MALGERDPHRLLEDQLGLGVAAQVSRHGREVEGDGDVVVAATKGRQRVLRLASAKWSSTDGKRAGRRTSPGSPGSRSRSGS